MIKKLHIASLALALGVLASPFVPMNAQAADQDPVVARVNGTELHRSDFMKELKTLGPQIKQMPMQMVYAQVLDKMIVTKLVSEKGYAQKLQNDKEVKDRLKDAETKFVADAYVRKMIEPKITEAKIKKEYDALAKKFKPEDEVRARHILVKTEKEAKDIIAKIKKGEDFAKLATEKSTDKGSAKQGGDLGYFSREAMVKPFAEAAFSMKNGEVSQKPVKTKFGYHILKIEDRRKSAPPPLSEVEGQIKNKVGQDLVEEMVKSIQDKAKIERFTIDGKPLEAKKK